MKIKLALLENDQNYLNRIVSVFNTKYADKFEVYSFTDKDVALEVVKASRIDVLIANEMYDISEDEIPAQCSFAYFVNSQDIEKINNQKAICKFQKVDVIYREVLGIYSEKAGRISVSRKSDDNCKVIMFSSPAGGTGNSTMAAACAMNIAKKGKKVLYLNLEKLGSSDVFFHADGSANMSDVLFAFKSKKAKLAFKLESCVKKDKSGVLFFSQSKYALDMTEVENADWIELIEELKAAGLYEYIVVDMDFSLEESYLGLYKYMDKVVWVNDGTDVTNTKTYRAFQACQMLEGENNESYIRNIALLYNKFSNKTGKGIHEEIGVMNVGGIPYYQGVTQEQIMYEVSCSNMFEKIY